jgi:hypothetical protein
MTDGKRLWLLASKTIYRKNNNRMQRSRRSGRFGNQRISRRPADAGRYRAISVNHYATQPVSPVWTLISEDHL